MKNRFRLSVIYDGIRFSKSGINRFLEEYRSSISELASHCRDKTESENTLGDFIYSNLSLDQFDAILERFQ
ncbi:MAG: hypothetical protein GY801_45880 [bacterium]|nr:hypothetical protein [bacterium]